MKDVVRIAAGSGFVNDSALAVPQLLERCGALDYLVFEYLAEGIMAVLSASELRQPGTGFSSNLAEIHLGPYLPEIMARGIKVVTNAGGLDPHAQADAIRAEAKALGLAPRIAVVTGDDLRSQLPELRQLDLRNLDTDEPFPEAVTSINVYLGAFPIAQALAGGADIVITGRCVDSAIALGPLIHEFGWTPQDYDQLAAGTAVGHLLECGAQVTGGTFTDWPLVKGFDDIGYPIAECRADGSFVLTKPEGTGGLVSVGTVSEQLLYEVGDGQSYLVPDVTCDFSEATLSLEGPDRVLVRDIKGRAPGNAYKACATYADGWRSVTLFGIYGPAAARKGRLAMDQLVARAGVMLKQAGCQPARDIAVEILGGEGTYGEHSRDTGSREVVCRIAAHFEDQQAAMLFGAEGRSLMTASVPGVLALGTDATAPVNRLFPCLVPKAMVEVMIDIDGQVQPVTIAPGAETPAPPERQHPRVAAADTGEALETVPLLGLAWVRSGDKGDLFNVAVIAREEQYLPWLGSALDEAGIADWYRHTLSNPQQPRVARHDLPGLKAMNFVVRDSLMGGQTTGMRSDCNAKGMGQQLLSFPVPVPPAIAREARARLEELALVP